MSETFHIDIAVCQDAGGFYAAVFIDGVLERESPRGTREQAQEWADFIQAMAESLKNRKH
jgi:hypothetical protein